MRTMRGAAEEIKRGGKAEELVQSPYVSIANRQAEIMMRIASEFGFTPASRSRISTPRPSERTLFDVVHECSDDSC